MGSIKLAALVEEIIARRDLILHFRPLMIQEKSAKLLFNDWLALLPLLSVLSFTHNSTCAPALSSEL